MKKIYVCSPCRQYGTRTRSYNLAKAVQHCRFVIDLGCSPIAPHLFFEHVLDDDKTADRTRGMLIGTDYLESGIIDELWVFGEHLSDGMKKEIEKAEELKIPIRYFYSSHAVCKDKNEWLLITTAEEVDTNGQAGNRISKL